MDWNDIPQELLELILSKVFAKDRYSFSLVCSSWNEVVASSPFRNSPCLMFNLKREHVWKFLQHNAFFYMDFPKLENAVIRFSNHGWLLMMSRDNGTLFFYNPFNNHMIQLPAPKYTYTTICFFHPPTSPKCFVAGFATQMKFPFDMMRIGVLKHGKPEWTESLIRTKNHAFKLSLGPPIYDNELLYFLDVNGNVGVYNVSEYDTSFEWVVFVRCLKQRRLRKNIKEHFLIKLKDEREIFAVFAMHDDNRKIRVFRLSDKFSWELVNDIGDRVFYVSNTSSFGYKTNVKSMTNKIFFPKLHGDNVVYYSLDTQKYHCFKGDYSSDNVRGLKRLDFATWTIPAVTDQQLPEESLAWCPQFYQTTA